MKRLILISAVIIAMGLFFKSDCIAATHYVVTNGTPGWIGAADPYTNWATAGTNIIDVVNTAMTNPAQRVVLVTNGTYYLTNQVAITNALTIQSVRGWDATILNGGYPTLSNRCFFTSSDGIIIDGFTITNFGHGHIYGGGGAYLTGSGTTIRNCLITRNIALNIEGSSGFGGGLSVASGIIVSNCTINGNTCLAGGAGIYVYGAAKNVLIVDCVVSANTNYGLYYNSPYGGGIICSGTDTNIVISNCYIINNKSRLGGGGVCVSASKGPIVFNACVITGNVAAGQDANYVSSGGGIYSASTNVHISNCRITDNVASNNGGGVCDRLGMNLRNSLVARNSTATNNGGGVWTSTGIVENCTIVSNYAKVTGGGLYIDTAGSGTNNIIYFNAAGVSADNFTNTAGNAGLQYSCVIPAVDGTRNIINDPSLVNLNGGDYRLKGNSPCVNAGLNKNWMTNAVDLDGRSRIRYGTVDMGAYERINAGVIYTVH